MDLRLEQRDVASALLAGENFRVVAHAGTGKTSRVLMAALSCPTKNIWLVGYNRKLKLDAQRAAESVGCRNVMCTNFDSVVVNYYDPSAASNGFDLSLARLLATEREPLKTLDFDVLIIDEAQDMHRPFFELTLKMRRDARRATQLVLLGDPKQTIYAFRGATSDFLMADAAAWGSNAAPTRTIYLSTTFRFGPGICAAINEAFRQRFPEAWWGRDVCSHGEGGRVTLWHVADGADVSHISREYSEAARRCAQGESVAVLSYSIKYTNDLLWSILEGAECGVPAPRTSPGESAPEVSTIFTAKGREFDHVYLVVSSLWPPELLYVGMTRARRSLSVVYDDRAALSTILDEDWCAAHGVRRCACDAPRPTTCLSVEPLKVLYGSKILDSCPVERCLALLDGVKTLGCRRHFSSVGTLDSLVCVAALKFRIMDQLEQPGLQRSMRALLSSDVDEERLRALLTSYVGRPLRLSADVSASLQALRAASWGMEQWCAFALCQPELFCGHVDYDRPDEEALYLAEAHFENFMQFAKDKSVRMPVSRHGLIQGWSLSSSDDLFALSDDLCTLVDVTSTESCMSSRHIYSLGLFEALDAQRPRKSVLLLQHGLEIEVEIPKGVPQELLARATA